MSSPFDITVYTDEWLLRAYQFAVPIAGQTPIGGKWQLSQLQPVADITGCTIGLTIRDATSNAFTPLSFDSNGVSGANIVIDDAVNAKWHYNINNSYWTNDLVARSRKGQLAYSLVLVTSGIPKRMWGGCFTVKQG